MVQRSYLYFAAKSLAFLSLVSLLFACGNSEQVVFKSSGVTQTFSEGKSAIPKDFESYVYPDATTSGSVSAEEANDEQSKFLMLSSKTTFDDVSKWYQDKLKSEHWKIVSNQEQSKVMTLTGSKDNTELSVMITEDSGITNISLSIDKQGTRAENDETKSETDAPNKDTPPTD